MKELGKSPNDLDDIYAVQFFHTHPIDPEKGRPNASPLSGNNGDIGVGKNHEIMFLGAGHSIPVHVYAISRVEDQLFVFHERNPAKLTNEKSVEKKKDLTAVPELGHYLPGELEKRLEALRAKKFEKQRDAGN